MKLFGLTGGIASGKSTVARMLRAQGAVVLDADAIYADLVAPEGGQPSALVRAIEAKIPGSMQSDGHLNREALRKKVFDDPSLRKVLNALTHPAVGLEFAKRIANLDAQGVAQVIYDVPLLYEANLQDRELNGVKMAGVIVVWVPRKVQLERLAARDGLTRAEAEQRLAAQMDLDKKKALADWVIDNSKTLAETEAAVADLWARMGAE